MGYVRIDHDASRRAAEQVGPEATRYFAEQIKTKAEVLAAARMKDKRQMAWFDIETGDKPQDTRVVMHVGVRGKQAKGDAAMSVETGHKASGYFKNGPDVEGLHILRDAVFG